MNHINHDVTFLPVFTGLNIFFYLIFMICQPRRSSMIGVSLPGMFPTVFPFTGFLLNVLFPRSFLPEFSSHTFFLSFYQADIFFGGYFLLRSFTPSFCTPSYFMLWFFLYLLVPPPYATPVFLRSRSFAKVIQLLGRFSRIFFFLSCYTLFFFTSFHNSRYSTSNISFNVLTTTAFIVFVPCIPS